MLPKVSFIKILFRARFTAFVRMQDVIPEAAARKVQRSFPSGPSILRQSFSLVFSLLGRKITK